MVAAATAVSEDQARALWKGVRASLASPRLPWLVAAWVFAVSVVSVPLIIDRNTTALEATRTSLRVAVTDLPAMIVWGAFIVALVALGFATFLIGMVIVFPLLGHATWHAYRDLVE